MKSIAIVSSSRADYGICRPIMRKIAATPSLDLTVIATGMHLSEKFGMTVNSIEADKIVVDHRIDVPLNTDGAADIAMAMGVGICGFSQLFADWQPDLLIVTGDRFDMYVAALAALPFNIPIGHIHGGDVTHGAIDDALRHSMTKLAHLHFVATEDSAHRVRQLGEEAWRIYVVGAPGLDNLNDIKPASQAEIEASIGISLSGNILLVTFHPVTLEYQHSKEHIEELLAALKGFDGPIVFTAPNADTTGTIIRKAIEAFVKTRKNACLVENLGTERFFGLMKISTAMVGNSSSGIIEAATFELPVVNIGARQQGRYRVQNVLDVNYGRDEIRTAIKTVCDPAFRNSLSGMKNPYGDGTAAESITSIIDKMEIEHRLVMKQFVDI